MWLTIWREHIDSVIKNTYMKSLIVKRKPKRSLEYSHKAIDTLSPAKRAKVITTNEPIEISPDIIDCPTYQPSEYFPESPSWIIPDTQPDTSIPTTFLNSLLNDPFVEKVCTPDVNKDGQACSVHGTKFYDPACNFFK